MTSEEILKKYLNISTIPCTIKSPFRKENKASFSVYYNKTRKAVYKDKATGEYGDGIDLLKQLYHISYKETLELTTNNIVRDCKQPMVLIGAKKPISRNNIIYAAYKQLQKRHRLYWADYLLTTADITAENNIEAVAYFTINGYTINCTNSITFAYTWWRKGIKYTKIYQPLNIEYRFISDLSGVSNLIYHNIHNLQNIGYVIITKSVKDVMVIKKCGYSNVIGMQSEGQYLPNKVIEYLYTKYNNIYLLLDNDFEKETNAGQNYASKIIEQYPIITNIRLPNISNCSDCSDIIKKTRDYKQLKNILQNEIKININGIN